MKRLLLTLLLLSLLPAQQLALPGYHWHFPQDDAAHPAFSTEWWYFTGGLQTYGFELTFFRVRPDLYFAHFAITDLQHHTFSYWTRARRGDWGQAGAQAGRLWNENWSATLGPLGPTHLDAAWGKGVRAMSLDLALDPGPRVLNGVRGWSQKGDAPGDASYYYSFPHMQARGHINGLAVAGLVWMDHEYSSGELAPNQVGWDWLGLHLASRGDLMLFNLRDRNGGRDRHSAGTWTPLGGTPTALTDSDFTLTPLAWWNRYVNAWRVRVPKLGLDFEVRAAVADQEVRDAAMGVAYWEGAVDLRGVAGEGYLEMTGYRSGFSLLHSN